MRMKSFLGKLAILLGAWAPFSAHAVLAVFEHGNGIQSMGMGGVGYSVAYETTALAANPAHALALGDRFDVGVDVFWAEAIASFEGNSAGPDRDYPSDAKSWYAIPQGGWSTRLSDRLGFGMTLLNAGLGPAYKGSPYERFGGDRNLMMNLASTSLVSALAYRLDERNVVGASLNVGYQEFSVKGLEFLDNPQSSVAPGHVTNQGKDGALTLGFSLGWYAELTKWASWGVGYRTRNWTQKHREYRGLITEGGRIELPSIYGIGLTLRPLPTWTVAMEIQRYDFRNQRAFRNGLSQFDKGKLLGSSQGPGFNFDNQTAFKLGVSWQATPSVALRAGYIYANRPLNSSDTLFGTLGCLAGTYQYTAGFVWATGPWEVSGMAVHMPATSARGRNSIPADFGGGEIDVSDEMAGAGFSIGRRF